VIDGFPNTLEQALAFEAVVTAPVFVLNLTTSDAVLELRVNERARCSGRADDNVATHLRHLEEYRTRTQPVVEHYAAAGKLRTVCADGPIEAVFAAAEPLFEGLAVSV
jgi:UMP-CMP kinase